MRETKIESPKSVAYLISVPFILLTLYIIFTGYKERMDIAVHIFNSFASIMVTFAAGIMGYLGYKQQNKKEDGIFGGITFLIFLIATLSLTLSKTTFGIYFLFLSQILTVIFLIKYFRNTPFPSFLSKIKILPVHIITACTFIILIKTLFV